MTEGEPSHDALGDESRMVGAVTPLPHSEHYHGPIWHFTNAAALVSIVERRRLWASAATMMNDPQELTYGADRISAWYEREGHVLPNHIGMHAILKARLRTIAEDIVCQRRLKSDPFSSVKVDPLGSCF